MDHGERHGLGPGQGGVGWTSGDGAEQRARERPLLLVAGTYGPHHTFVAPEPLYRKYLDLVEPPTPAAAVQMHPALRQANRRKLSPETLRCIRAAYYGLIEHTDQQLGRVLEAWDVHLERTGREGVFCYLSDHGEQAGHRGLWGKMSFYEDSAAIPLIFRGTGIQAGLVHDVPVSIMDLGPTLCQFGGTTPPPEQDGVSLAPVLAGEAAGADRPIYSEVFQHGRAGRMVRRGRWKYIAYDGFEGQDFLFDLANDPTETRNALPDNPDVGQALREDLWAGWNPLAIADRQRRQAEHRRILAAWGAAVPVPEPERWPVPRSSWQLPTV